MPLTHRRKLHAGVYKKSNGVEGLGDSISDMMMVRATLAIAIERERLQQVDGLIVECEEMHGGR